MADRFTAGPLSVMRSNGPRAEGEVGILDDQRNVVAECWADIRFEGEQALDEAMANAVLFAHASRMVDMLRRICDQADASVAEQQAKFDLPVTRSPRAQALYDEARALINAATGSAQ